MTLAIFLIPDVRNPYSGFRSSYSVSRCCIPYSDQCLCRDPVDIESFESDLPSRWYSAVAGSVLAERNSGGFWLRISVIRILEVHGATFLGYIASRDRNVASDIRYSVSGAQFGLSVSVRHRTCLHVFELPLALQVR